jgi:hypothetical protein
LFVLELVALTRQLTEPKPGSAFLVGARFGHDVLWYAFHSLVYIVGVDHHEPRAGWRVDELLRKARAAGWSATLCGSGHWRLEHPDASRAVIVPATPSDRRWHLNALAEIKRALPPEPKRERAERRIKRRPTPPNRSVPVVVVELPEEVPLPPPRRIAGGPHGWRSPWSRLW